MLVAMTIDDYNNGYNTDHVNCDRNDNDNSNGHDQNVFEKFQNVINQICKIVDFMVCKYFRNFIIK